MPTGTTILRPNASNFFTSVGWRSSPLTANNLWYTLVNETPPDGDTTFFMEVRWEKLQWSTFPKFIKW